MRTILVGGPRVGKSTLARQIQSETGARIFCGDPRSLVKEPEDNVTYLPEGLGWGESSRYVADTWFQSRGPWVCEGQVMARALRKWTETYAPADRIVVFDEHHPMASVTAGQSSMHKAVMTVWREIEDRFRDITEHYGRVTDGTATRQLEGLTAAYARVHNRPRLSRVF